MDRALFGLAFISFLSGAACTSPETGPCVPITLDASACDPTMVDFTLDSTNPYYPLHPGLRVVLEGQEDGLHMRVEREVLQETQMIDGVEVHILEHKTFHEGELHELARNFYVETTQGTVCYFGEDVEFYEGGQLMDTHGTWRVGVDGAEPGIIMPAQPSVGQVYYQERAPGIAEDMGRITASGETLTVGTAEFEDVLTIMDANPIDDEERCEDERKRYAPGVGEITDVALEYLSHEPAPLP